MPGVFQYSVDRLLEPVQQLAELEIPAVLLFGIPEVKDALGTSAWQNDGVVQQAIREIKKLSPQTIVITDVCMCEYTDHGHCGALDENGQVVNDITLDLLAREALSHAKAGCDMVAPSDMMDGRVGAIRKALDEGAMLIYPLWPMQPSILRPFTDHFVMRLNLLLSSVIARLIKWTERIVWNLFGRLP